MKTQKVDQPVWLIAIVTMLLMLFGAVGPLVQSAGAQNEAAKVFVCKYVGIPGVDEQLQTGNNPISVSVNAIPNYQGIGSYFADAHGRSFVLGVDTRTGGGQEGEPSVDECPPPVTPTPPPTVTPETPVVTPVTPVVTPVTPVVTPVTPVVTPVTPTVTPVTPGVTPTVTPVTPGVTPTVTPVTPGVMPTVTPVTPGVVPTAPTKEPPKVAPVPAAPAKVTTLPSTGSGTSDSDQLLIVIGGLTAVVMIAIGLRKRVEA